MRPALVSLLCLAAAPALAQSKTSLEQSLARTGAVVVKTIHALDAIEPSEGPGSATLSAITLTDPRNAAFKQKGLAVTVDDASDRADSVTTAYVDLDEVAGLIGALDWMTKAMADWSGKEREAATAVYATKGGLSVGFSFADGKSVAHLQAGRSRIAVDAEMLQAFRGYLALDKDKLAAK